MSPQETLATLLAMPRTPIPPDRRSQERVDHDAALEQLAEARELARTEPTSAADAEYLAERNERAWSA